MLIKPDYRSVVLNAFAQLGSPVVVTLGAFAAAAARWRHQKWRAVASVLGPALAGTLTEYVLKPWFDPRIHGLEFPSGHEAGATALAVAALLALPHRWLWRAAPVAAAVLLALAATLVSLGWHTPTDALAGITTGAGAVLLAEGAIRLSTLGYQRWTAKLAPEAAEPTPLRRSVTDGGTE